MTNEKIQELLGALNRNEVTPEVVTDLKKLIHLFNLRENGYKDLFQQAVYLRRRWRKQHVEVDKLGHHLTFLRKLAYSMIKLRIRK